MLLNNQMSNQPVDGDNSNPINSNLPVSVIVSNGNQPVWDTLKNTHARQHSRFKKNNTIKNIYN